MVSGDTNKLSNYWQFKLKFIKPRGSQALTATVELPQKGSKHRNCGPRSRLLNQNPHRVEFKP